MREFRFSIDRGGTFTDVFAEFEDEAGATHARVLKLLSVDPSNYPDAPREGIRRVLEQETGVPHPRDRPLDTSKIASIRMGTTVRESGYIRHIMLLMGFKLLWGVLQERSLILFCRASPLPLPRCPPLFPPSPSRSPPTHC